MRRMIAIASVFALACLGPGVGFAQRATLSDGDIDAAIAAGMKEKGKEQGLSLVDSGQAFLIAMGGAGPSRGFSVIVYTPTTWIRQQASQAAKRYQPFSHADVTEEMLVPVLRVIVSADLPTQVTASGTATASSVEHVVLRDENKKTAVQPLSEEPFDQEASNAMGGKKMYQGIQAQFDLDALKGLRGLNGDKEFLLTVIGEGRKERDFTIKKKHFEHIP